MPARPKWPCHRLLQSRPQLNLPLTSSGRRLRWRSRLFLLSLSTNSRPPMARSLLSLIVWLLLAMPARPLEQITFRGKDGTAQRASGKVLVTDAEGGVLLLSRDGTLRSIEKKDLVERTSDAVEFKPYTADEAAKAVLAELPPGFESLETANYVILHNTSKGYAGWCGGLLERLHRNFINFWSRRGFELHE